MTDRFHFPPEAFPAAHKIARVTEYLAGQQPRILHLTPDEMALYRFPQIGCRVSVTWIETKDAAGAIPHMEPTQPVDGMDGKLL